jgi:protein ImuB
LPRARVAERFDKEAVILHRVASGELDALPGQRDLGLQKKMKRIRGEYTGSDEQLGFFGQRGAADERADQAALRVRRRLGPEGVLLAVLRGGRAPQDRATLVPWGSPPSKNLSAAPWPGLHQAPSPASTFAQPVSVKLTDGEGRDVLVGARGGLSATPARLSFHSTQHLPVTWFAGPWPLVERWWEKGRRRVHVQILLESGQALLLCAEEGQWWLVGMYD